MTDSQPATEPTAKPKVNRTLPPEALESWLAALATELGIDPADVPIGAVLDIARDVAYGVARPAAPLSTFLVGFAAAQRAAAGEDLAEALGDAAQRTSGLAGRWADLSAGENPTAGGVS